MVETVGGANVVSLERCAIGKITIEGLKYGQYRRLTKDEVKYLQNL